MVGQTSLEVEHLRNVLLEPIDDDSARPGLVVGISGDAVNALHLSRVPVDVVDPPPPLTNEEDTD